MCIYLPYVGKICYTGTYLQYMETTGFIVEVVLRVHLKTWQEKIIL